MDNIMQFFTGSQKQKDKEFEISFKKKELFDHLNNITMGKQPFNEDDPSNSSYSKFMINRFISMSPQFIHIASVLNKYPNITDKAHHDFLCNVLPQQKTYFKYMRGKKEANADDIDVIMTYFQVGKTVAKEYFGILTKEQMKKIAKKYHHGIVKNKRGTKK